MLLHRNIEPPEQGDGNLIECLCRFLTASACLWSLGSPSFYMSLRASSTPTSTTGLTVYGCAAAGNTKVQGEVKRSEGQALHTGGGPMHYLHVIILIQRTCTT